MLNALETRLKPEEAIGIPLAEVDQSVMEDTYCVISRSWGHTYVHRYSRLPTLYLFHPYSSARRAAIAFTTHICYDMCMLFIVLANLIDLAVPNSLPLLFERVTIIFYIAEALHETIGRGFIFGSYSYLKNPWMCLDFVITVLSLPDLELSNNKTFGIQSLRGIRVLYLITKVPGVQSMAQAIILSMLHMYGVAMIMLLFLLSVSLTAKQLFMGIFRRRCVRNLPEDFSSLDMSYYDFVNDYANWDIDDHGNFKMCGNITGSQKCQNDFTCLLIDVESDMVDLTSFDTFSLSLINSFRFLTQDEWEIIYDKIIQATGPLCILFFLPVIVFGSFFLLNLMLVVVTSAFDSIMNAKEENKPLCNYKWNNYFRFDIKRLALYPLATSPKELKRVFWERDEILQHQRWLKRILLKVKNIITLNLNVHETDSLHGDLDQMSNWKKFRTYVKKFSDSKPFHYFIQIAIIFNAALLASEHARMSKEFTIVMKYCNVVVTAIFTFEVIVCFIADGKRYFLNWWNILDFLIVVQSVVSIVLDFVAEYSIFRSLRLLELMKVQQEWPALQRVISIVLSSVKNIVRLLFVMLLLMFTFAVIGNRVLGQIMKEDYIPPRKSFMTFGGALVTVFEIFAGEWYEPLTYCMASVKIPLLCVAIIIPYYVIGFLVVLSVFTAVLLSAFDASALELPKLRKSTVPKVIHIDDLLPDPSDANLSYFRKIVLYLRRFVRRSIFEYFIFVLIVGSSITMAFEDIYIHKFPRRKLIVQSLNLTFTILFLIEMLMRWASIGINHYFMDAWRRFDFILVMLSLVELFVVNVFTLPHYSVDGLRTLRAARPLRLIPRWKGLQLVVHSLVLSLPAMFHVLLVVLFIWLPFAILGVHFFAGQFFHCVDEFQEAVYGEVYNITDCIEKGYLWQEMFYNFNHIGNSYLCLFQLALFTGWTELVQMMVDFNKEGLQPILNNRSEYYTFVVIFVFLGAFFSLNMFVGVAVDTFKRSERHVKTGVVDMLLTDSQQKYYGAMLSIANRKPVVRTDPPSNKILKFFYSVTYSIWFRVLILLFICINTVVISLDSYNDPPQKKVILHHCDLLFTILYTLELTIKVLGLRRFYFNDFWNVFDFTILTIHIIGDIFPHDPEIEANPLSFLYALRLLRIVRLLRLTDMLVDLRRLLHAMVASIPALINISILLLLVIYTYSLVGMSLFGHLAHHGVVSVEVNFQTFIHSYLLLFRLTTAQGWEELLESLSVQPPFCDKNIGSCGNVFLAVFFLISFIIISNIILVNLFIAVILENYLEAIVQENYLINDDNLVNFYRQWKQFDPQATQFILYEQLSDFLDQLNKDMRVPKPNQIAIVYMNLPLVEGKKIHCSYVLKGILELKVRDVENSDTFHILCEKAQKKLEQMFPNLKETKFVDTTLQLKRRDFAARVIQTNLKRMRRNRDARSDQKK